jgi:hypothetical protein
MMKLKSKPGHIKTFVGRSDVLTKTNVPVGSNPRGWYLKDPSSVTPPCISCSEFVPDAMIEHLMRNKKNSALGVKFQAHRAPPDKITNLEGALHTFVTPIMLAYLHGDYLYRGGHGMTRFSPLESMQQARVVVVSAQIQPDFEGPDVLAALAALKEDPLSGLPLPDDFVPPDAAMKQDGTQRADYDLSLKRHMIAHLTKGSRLPSTREASSKGASTVAILENFIQSPHLSLEPILGNYVQLQRGPVLSLELLFNTAVHQLRNELSALEAVCPQGYVYTSDPPSIFAMEIGAEILNRLQFAALKYLADKNKFLNMRAFAFNNYADPGAVGLLKAALSNQPHILVVPKSSLFEGPRSTYAALPGTEGALLVIHNNSDAFGQNIETEWESGSMDGAIGANSSTAASLKRNRSDLVSNLM